MGADVLGVVVVDLAVEEYVDAVLPSAAAAVVVVVVLVLVDLVAEVLVVELGGRWAALAGVAREVIAAETASINNNKLTIWNMQDRQAVTLSSVKVTMMGH